MRKFTLLFAMLLPLATMAQRTDLDKEWFNYSYRHLPSKPIDNSFMTYSVIINKTVALDMYSNESANSLINIEGRKKIDGTGHFIVTVSLSDLIIESSQVKERVEIHKDKDGKETGRSYYYKVEVVYSFGAEAKVNDYKGLQMAFYTLTGRSNKKTYSTGEYSKAEDASNFYNNNKLEIKTQLISQSIEEALASLNTSLNIDFGYKTITTRENLWALGTKKSPEYVAFGQACGTLKAALESVSNDAVPANIAERMQPAVDYFTSLTQKYNDPEEKDQKKLRYGAYYNMAFAYALTEQFDKAVEMANKLIANDYDKKDGENIIKDIEKIKEDLEKHGMTTRHFYPDAENAAGPQL